jgi:phosphonate transport system substrate-binding protein
MHYHRSIVSLLLVLFSSSSSSAEQENQTLTLGIHPFLPAHEIIKKFTPITTYLVKETGLNIETKVGTNYDEHIDQIGADRIDIAFMGPVSYINLLEKYGKKPLLARLETNGKSTFQGHIVVHEDSPIKTLSALKGKTIAFGNSNSTMSYVVPHFMLQRAGVFDENSHKEHVFLNNHINVALAVLTGDFHAGAIKPAVYQKYKAKGLRSLAVTPDIPEHLFIARSGLSQSKIDRLRSAMLNMANSKQGLAALKSLKSSLSGLVNIKYDDYDKLREIIKNIRQWH